MKRIISILLVIFLMLLICGCQRNISSYVNFYYCNRDISFDDGAAVIIPEKRKISVPNSEMETIITLYMEGPSSTKLVSPFRAGTKLVNLSSGKQLTEIILSDEIAMLTGVELTIACGCLASTVIALTQTETVVIRAETAQLGVQGYVEMNAQSLQLIN